MSPDNSDSSARPGVRSNALPAATFARLRIVDARISDALLDVLEDAGIAAYVEPSAGEVGVYRDVRAYRSPSEQLYVDSARSEVARQVLEAELPGMLADLESDPADQDELFASIVAGFHDSAGTETAGWPATEQATSSATDTAEHDDQWYAARPAPEPEEDHYEPPPPPPLPRLSGGKLWGLVLLIGGFVLMILLPQLDFASETAIIIGILTTSAGAATLVWWMRDGPTDDPDDGAVV